MLDLHAQSRFPRQRINALDLAGSTLAILCFAHCMLAPVLILSVPLLGDETTELAFLGVLGTFAVLVIGRGVLRHRQVMPAAILMLGLGILASVRLTEGADDMSFVKLIDLAGSLLVVVAHVLNHRALCRCCPPKLESQRASAQTE